MSVCLLCEEDEKDCSCILHLRWRASALRCCYLLVSGCTVCQNECLGRKIKVVTDGYTLTTKALPAHHQYGILLLHGVQEKGLSFTYTHNITVELKAGKEKDV